MGMITVSMSINSGLEELLNVRKTKAERAEIVKDGMTHGLLWWFREVLPKHFQRIAYTLYSPVYLPRKYWKYKRKKLGHNRPMVFSGQLYGNITSRYPTMIPARGATSMVVKMQMYGGRHLNFWRGDKPPGHNFRASIAYMRAREKNKIIEIMGRYVVVEIQKRVAEGHMREMVAA